MVLQVCKVAEYHCSGIPVDGTPGQATLLSDSIFIVKHLEEIIPVGSAALQYVWSQFVHQNLSTSLAKSVGPLCPGVLSKRGKEYHRNTRKWRGPLEA